MSNKGSIIALAWPETKVVHEGKWYDKPMQWFGILKNGYYTAGHAAMIIANYETLEFKYYDFGRYHTPSKKGRVRSFDTDPELKLTTRIVLRNDKIDNIKELLTELQSKKACHGEGKLLASVYENIDLEKAILKAEKMQNKGVICYGPFTINGTNCSRFVNQVTKYATKSMFKRLLLSFPYTITASPKFNIRMINSKRHYFMMLKDDRYEIQSKFFTKQPVW